MLLGKRSRHPIKRTTSMTGITVDVSSNVEDVVVDDQEPIISDDPQNPLALHDFPNPNLGYDQRLMAMVSPRIPASSSATTNHLLHTAPFLRSCCLCKRRLAPGRDIYMYRGDTAFCSLECREEQMKEDERSEKLKGSVRGSKNKEDRHGSSSTSKASTKTEPLAAA